MPCLGSEVGIHKHVGSLDVTMKNRLQGGCVNNLRRGLRKPGVHRTAHGMPDACLILPEGGSAGRAVLAQHLVPAHGVGQVRVHMGSGSPLRASDREAGRSCIPEAHHRKTALPSQRCGDGRVPAAPRKHVGQAAALAELWDDAMRWDE